MKKYSFTSIWVLAILLVTITSSSCARKVGCYYSLETELKSHKELDPLESGNNLSKEIDALNHEVLQAPNCDSY